MAAHTYELTARVRIFRKDLEIIEAFARTVGAVTPMLSAAAEIYEQAAAAGFDEHDVTSIHELYMIPKETHGPA
jgi:3-hydroxyisobutyrate dehydrogenase-like beta-hydroxyacid dehydrogenase